MTRMPDRIKRVLLRGRSITIDGNTLDTTLQLSLAASRLSGREGLILSEDPATARTRLNLVVAGFPRVPADVTTSDLSVPGPGGDIPAVHIRPRNGGSGAPLLVYFHGGGFVVGGYETHGNLCEVISDRAGVHVLFVDYRLAPEHKAPAAAEDAYAAYLWAREHAAELGADPDSGRRRRRQRRRQPRRRGGATRARRRCADAGHAAAALPDVRLHRPHALDGPLRRRLLPAPLGYGLLPRPVHRRLGYRSGRSAGLAPARRGSVRPTAGAAGDGGVRPVARSGPSIRRRVVVGGRRR